MGWDRKFIRHQLSYGSLCFYYLLGLQYSGGIIEDYQSFRITLFQGDPRTRGQQEDHGDVDGEQSWPAAGFSHQQCRDGQGAGE